ncbi:SusC/RagA family TonB-linked outer membrane protein [Dysgonomonas macrotermitis]|uniref:TonB-linked outer membrane protein, SusC/RagA family n=1 Tax=Dysgonomonas macrotermitis TaxID=1346286 RepID=A0A1M4YPE7_9BACT|nr:TonB-dependent receptor [Dysgonomonas macrotermitis]SHF07517.1 TonB-linked outer membrane protein, SusC/RagA family [Dysgonomonas macrotermitis]
MESANLQPIKRKPATKGLYRKMGFILLCCFAFALQAQAQKQINVSGTVVDPIGEPIIGATVAVEKSTQGTTTDLDGKFVLSVSSNAVLKVSYLGYLPQTIAVNNRTSISVTLQEDSENLDEVIVIGYGTVKKKDLTGAVSSVRNEDIVIAPTSDVMEALQGKISGMDINKSTGQIGQKVDIRLRGNRSIYGSNEPLFVIDGIISGSDGYSQINPSDIESVDVLKDASSTAIYGSAGANGVVIITTKRGKEGKAIVNFDAYYGFSGTPEFYHGMTGDEWTNYRREAYKYKNGQYPADMGAILTDADKLAAYNAGKWIDWVDQLSGNTATMQKYNLSVSGGNAKTKVFGSASYEQQKGLLENEDLNRYAMRLNVDQEIFPWAKAGFISNLTHSLTNAGVKNTFTKALAAFPLGDMYDAEGNLNYEYATDSYTPLGDFIPNQFVDNTRYTYINPSAYLELTPIKGLMLKSVASARLTNSRRGQYWGAKANANRPSYAGTPHAGVTNTYTYNYMWDNIVTYNHTFNKDHDLTATFVTSWEKTTNEDNKAEASGQNLDSWSFYRLLAGTSARVESNYIQSQKMSYVGRLNYSYKSKYLLSVSSRWDGVSWFSDGQKWDVFPAGALAWRISEESFMENTKDWLDNLKLRFGYGVTGNSGGVAPYSTQTNAYAYSSAGISIDGKNVPFTQYTGTYGSKGLGWEKSYNMNIGLDFTLFGGRIDAAFEWFNTKTKDLLFMRTMPITSGATGWGSPLKSWENIAETSNKGIELTVNSRNIRTNDFTWNSTLTFTWSKEKIESLPSGDLVAENLFEGQPIGSFYDYKYQGIWGSDTPASVLEAYGVKPGWIILATNPQIVDGVSDEGVHKYSEKDRYLLGHSNPDWIVGFNNTFRYKDFDLSVFVMARYGQTVKSNLMGWYNAKIGDNNNQISGADYWTETNQGAYFPVAGSGDEQAAYMPSLQYRDGSFVKVKNITLGYTLPLRISQVALMDRCRFYFTAYNPFIYVKDKQLRGTDPETKGSDSFPLYKQFVFGVNLTF